VAALGLHTTQKDDGLELANTISNQGRPRRAAPTVRSE